MLKVLFISFISGLLLFNLPYFSSPVYEKNVFLCNSTGGKRYHFTKTCKGLSNCKHEIIKVTLSEAKKRGKTICGWED